MELRCFSQCSDEGPGWPNDERRLISCYKQGFSRVTPGFRRGVSELCPLLGFYAIQISRKEADVKVPLMLHAQFAFQTRPLTVLWISVVFPSW
jgi:hypothetical protein